MLIFRVENAKGMGPYQGLDNSGKKVRMKAIIGDTIATTRSPTPFGDFDFQEAGDKIGQKDWVFGFPSLSAAYRWFGRRKLMAMRDCGFCVTLHEIEDELVVISRSRRQCIFMRKS